jgi:peptide/nickel transport system substrate-binding protein
MAPKPKGRRKLIAAIVVAVIVIAAVAAFLFFYLGSGSMTVTSTSQFVSAGNSSSFQALVSSPPLVNVGTITWNFGDNQTLAGSSGSAGHTYTAPGNYLVQASAALSNGNTASNALKLFPVQVGVPESIPGPLGTTSVYGAITFNVSKSSPGAPTIGTGGHIDFVGAPTQSPTFEFDSNPSAGTWVNYTWAITSLTLTFGDGQSASSSSATPYEVSHTYNSAGLFFASLKVTTSNESATQVGGGTPTIAPTGATQSTVVGMTVAVGTYGIVTYQGNIVKPGIITNMEAVTGGYTSLDPALDYESTGFEIIANVYETLLEYNGTSTSSFVPVVADSIPTLGNGGISSDFMNYTFHVRPNLKFSNGDPVTAWDVKYSITRTMLMNSGSPFPPGWILSQFLVNTTFVSGLTTPWGCDLTKPGCSLDAAMTYAQVNGAISVNNATQTVIFHLVVPAPPLLFYQVISDPLGGAIVDHLWLESGGNPALVWNPTGFVAYEAYSQLRNYVSAWRNGAVGSGPFMIDYVSNPDSVVLKPNPNFTPLPGVPAPTVSKVVLMYVADDSTRELSIESGQADIAGIVTSHFDVAKRLQGAGLAKILFVATLNMFWWNFNLEIANSAVGSNSNPYGNQVPSNFFVDLNMRKAFFYAFNFQQYLGQIVGNTKFNATFGTGYNGIIPKGMIGYQDLSAMNTYDMTLAHQYFNQTQWVKDHGWASSGFTVAINVETADTVNRAGAAMWAQSLEQLAPPGQITILIKPISFAEEISNSVPHANPMGIYLLGWLPDYPFPTDYTLPMELPADSPVASATPNGGTYPNANGFNIQYLAADKNGTNQVANATKVRNWIVDSISTNATDVNQVVIDSQLAQMAAANLTLYVPTYQQFTFFTYRTWITGMETELNPTLGGTDLLYNFITKPSTATTSSLSTSSSPLLNSVMLVTLSSPMMTIALVGLGGHFGPRRKE